jgi:hypothetical protein
MVGASDAYSRIPRPPSSTSRDRASSYRVLRVRGRPLEREYRLTVSPLDSHPLGPGLGLGDQTIRSAFRTESDFVVEPGRVVWESGSVPARR